ncbi:MAG: phage regulatory CII family protein [Verrucomicrobiota bacterium]
MESHEVIKSALARTSPKAVAAELGVSLSLVYKWAQPNTDLGSGSRNPLDRIRELMELTGEPRIIQWLCQQAGGHFVENPERRSSEDSYEVAPATTEIVHQFSELLQAITKAAEDRSINKDESDEIREIWDQLKTFTEGFVLCCEEGDFQRMPSIPLRAQQPRSN